MKILTSNPNVTINTDGGHCESGEDLAHEAWIGHCEGSSLDETALLLAEEVQDAFISIPHGDATEYTYGVIRELLRKSRKPTGVPANLEGASQ